MIKMDTNRVLFLFLFIYLFLTHKNMDQPELDSVKKQVESS